MEYSEDQGTLIHENILKSKISCHTPFKFQEINITEKTHY
jgi:hypothetical protein